MVWRSRSREASYSLQHCCFLEFKGDNVVQMSLLAGNQSFFLSSTMIKRMARILKAIPEVVVAMKIMEVKDTMLMKIKWKVMPTDEDGSNAGNKKAAYMVGVGDDHNSFICPYSHHLHQCHSPVKTLDLRSLRSPKLADKGFPSLHLLQTEQTK